MVHPPVFVRQVRFSLLRLPAEPAGGGCPDGASVRTQDGCARLFNGGPGVTEYEPHRHPPGRPNRPGSARVPHRRAPGPTRTGRPVTTPPIPAQHVLVLATRRGEPPPGPPAPLRGPPTPGGPAPPPVS